MPALIALGLLLAGGMGALAATGGIGLEGDEMSVTMVDGAIELDADSVTPGSKAIEVRNEGATEHELVIVRTDLPVDELPVGLHGVSVSASGELVLGEDHIAEDHEHGPGEVLGLLPGQSLRYQVDLEPGRHVLFCQTGNHYLHGQRAVLEVE